MLHNLLKELRLKLKPKMTEKTPTIFISIYLIYNNELYDLLKGKEKLATGTNNGFFDNLQKKSVEDKEDLELLLKQAINNRKILGSEINQPELKRKSHLIIRVQMSEELYFKFNYLLSFLLI